MSFGMLKLNELSFEILKLGWFNSYNFCFLFSNTRGSPGLVKRRVLEMSQQSSLNRKGSRNSPSSPRRSSPNFGRRGPNPPKKSTNLLAPKPFAKPSEGSKNVQKPEFYMKFTSPKKSSSLPQQSPTKKPAVPPKPRNVIVSRRKSQKIEDDPNEQNDSGLSGKKIYL